MRTYKLYAAIAATGNNVVMQQILRPCRLKRLRYSLSVDSITDNAILAVEVSINPISQIAQSAIQGAVDEIRWCGNFVTSGIGQGAFNPEHNLDFPLGAGEFLYVNAYVLGTLAAAITIFADVEER